LASIHWFLEVSGGSVMDAGLYQELKSTATGTIHNSLRQRSFQFFNGLQKLIYTRWKQPWFVFDSFHKSIQRG